MIDVKKLLSKRIENIKNNPFKKDIDKYYDLLNKCIFERKVLVIGGAGTIGSNYIKQIFRYKPSKLVVVDINENALTELTRDLRSSVLLDYKPNYITYPVNLLSDTFDKIFLSEKWDIVSNFSAHKHVRSEKDVISIEALLKNNVFGAIKLLDLCQINSPNYFFSVSTDKAANPVNIMGASKTLMEKLIISKMNSFRVSTARFANVAFSNGSLLEGFNNRLNKRQPLSCPSDIKRFFVTPRQSGEICLLATFLGESGNIFFPKLDFEKDQVYFRDIALDYLGHMGYIPKLVKSEKKAKNFNFEVCKNNYPVYFFETDTSGEKSHEQFFTNDEKFNTELYYSLGYIVSKEVNISFKKVKNEFQQIFNNKQSSKSDFIELINKYIPGFTHIETGKNLDQKM